MFVGDRQIDDLDERLILAETDVVSFVRLVPLVGGLTPLIMARRRSEDERRRLPHPPAG